MGKLERALLPRLAFVGITLICMLRIARMAGSGTGD